MSSEQSNRILVNGLPPDTTYSMVEGYFSQFGTLTECNVLFEKVNPLDDDAELSQIQQLIDSHKQHCKVENKSKNTGEVKESDNCRGYAFISFLDNRCVEKCLRLQSHINGVRVHLRPLSKMESDNVMNKVPVKKILLSYVGGSLSKHQIYEYFSDFGRIKIDYCRDNEDEEHYAYVMFEDEFACRTCLAICEHSIDGHLVEIRAVVRKEELMKAEQAERENAERLAVDLARRSELELRRSGGTQSDPPIATVAPYCQQQDFDFTKAQQPWNQSGAYGPPLQSSWPVASKSASSMVDVTSGCINYAAQIPTSYPTHIFANNQHVTQHFPVLKATPDCTLPPSLTSQNRNMAAPTTSTYTLKRQQITSFTSHSNAPTIEHPHCVYNQRQWEEDEPLTKLSAHDGTLSSALAGYGSWDRRRNEVAYDVSTTF